MKQTTVLVLAMVLAAPVHAWTFQSERNDFTDEAYYYTSKFGSSSLQSITDYGPGYGYVQFTCFSPGEFGVYVDMNEVLGSMGEERELRYRAGDGVASMVVGPIVGDDQSAIRVMGADALHIAGEMIDASERLGFLESLSQTKKIAAIFSAADWRGQPHMIYVWNAHSAKSITKVLQACGLNKDGTAYRSPQERKREAADSIDKVLEDSGADTSPAKPVAKPRSAVEKTDEASGQNPLQAVGGFVGDAAKLFTGSIEVKEGGSEKLQP